MSYDRQKIIDGYPIADFIRKQGRELKGTGEQMISCLLHADKTPSMSINTEKNVYKCFSCGQGGSVIDLCMQVHHIGCGQAMEMLAKEIGLEHEEKRTTTYHYKDRHGREVMAVDRVQDAKGKQFYQSHMENGKKVSGVAGVERVLYRLNEWYNADEIEIAEGEKCADALVQMGYEATSNPGGSNGWLESYASYLKDKHVTIWPDNDEPGEKWCDAVFKSLGELPKSIRICRVPEPYNDVADILVAKGEELACEVIVDIAANTPRIERGHDLPVYSAAELEARYAKELLTPQPIKMDLGLWIPAFRDHVRPLIPGDVVSIIGGTGIGKTSIIQNALAYGTRLPSLLFELELSDYLMAERQIALSHNVSALEVEQAYLSGKRMNTTGWAHIWTCPVSGLTVERMVDIINRAELKMGERPKVVGVDYLQLMKGGFGKRYERMSDIAEAMKVVAKECKVILFQLSQIARKGGKDDDEPQEVYLDDGKDSGSIENSSSLVIGAWKTHQRIMMMKILKNSRGTLGEAIECDFDGAKYRIKQRALVGEVRDPSYGGRYE